MARRARPALLLVAVLAAAATSMAEAASIGWPPSLHLAFNAHIAPTKLPKGQPAGVSLRINSKVWMADGSPPPALGELLLALDKNVAIDARGLPVCHFRPLEDARTQAAERDCKEALVGVGEAEFEIAFPEQPPFLVSSKALAFNAGVSAGKTKLLLQAYLASPVSAAVLIPVQISKVSKGRYGLEAVAEIPKVAGGYGSITSLSLKLGRKFTYKGKQQSYLLAKCPDGQLVASETGSFIDGSSLTGSVVRTCTAMAQPR